MARGTGLPYPTDDATVQPSGLTPQIDSALASNAATWGQIAQAGAQLRDMGVDRMEREVHKKKVGYMAEQEVEIARKRIDLSDKYKRDPQGFDREWTAYSDGKLSEAEAWAVPHLKGRLGQEGNSAYGSLLNDKSQHDEALDGRRVKALAEQASSDVIGAAMTGTLPTPAGQMKVEKYRAVLDTAVVSGFMTQDEADLQMLEVTSRAGAESTIKAIGDTYRDNRAKGLEAGDLALKEAEASLLRTADPRLGGLSEEQRYGYFHKATAEIRALEAERKQDLGIARQAKTDAETALTNGVRVGPDTIDDIVKQLEAAGGQADAARLRASAVRFDRLAAFGRQPLRAQVEQYQAFSVAAGSSSDSGLEFIRREEGFTPTAKWDVRQHSVGFGTKGAPGETITREEAERRLRVETEEIGKYLDANVKVPLTQSQRDALISFGFNLGTDDIGRLLDDINAGNHERVAQRMLSFNQVEGQPHPAIAARRKREADLYAGATGGPVVPALSGPGIDHRLLSGQRKILSAEAKEQWGKIEKQLDAGERPSPQELNTLIQAATIGGDHDLLEEIGERVDRLDASKIAGQAPLTTQQGAVAELNAAGAAGKLTAGQSAWKRDLEKVTADTEKKLADDPIGLGAERFSERIAPPAPLDFSSPEAARRGMEQRISIARFVGENYGKKDIPALSPADRTAIASAIASPSDQPQQKAANGAILAPQPSKASVALDLLASLPDDHLFPTLETKEIKTALSGAVRSTDPANYLVTMQTVDRLWARAPEDTYRLIGDDGVKSLQDWQAKLRYHSPEQVADDLRRRDDPQVRERMKTVREDARKVFSKQEYKIEHVVDDLDPGFFMTGPDEPTDIRARDTAMADFEALFVERYAETQDVSTARAQAIERMRLHWGRSELNSGRLTLYAPESKYAPVNGSHDWMKAELVDELTSRLGTMPEDYNIITDQRTQRDVDSGVAPSYLVSIKTPTGWDMLRGPDNRPMRFAWDRKAPAQEAREKFATQRARVLPVNRGTARYEVRDALLR